MIVEGVGIRPWNLAKCGPNTRFLDVGSRFVITRKKSHGMRGTCAFDRRAEKLRKEIVDGGAILRHQFGRVILGS